MEKFKNLEKIAEGTFGIVYKATENEEVVAIKEMKAKYTNWEECKSLREVKSLINLKHENIVKLKELNLEKETLYLVFEFMEKNLYDLISVLIKKNKKFSESQIKYIIYQTLNGIAYMHRYGFFHRDLKPENLLVKGESVKIADFGLAREIRSLPPYTDYVSTRWYRAPECLLKASNYNSPIDIWALGAIMAELYSLKPLFPGTSEKDQLFKICSIIGSPLNQWAEAINLAKKIEFKFPNVNGQGIKASCPEASPEAIEVITEMLKWDPNKRATASKLLTFPFFSKVNLNTKISMIFNDLSNEGYYNNNIIYSNDQNLKKTITKQEENDIDKMIEEIKNEEGFKKSPNLSKTNLIANNHLKYDNFDDLLGGKNEVLNNTPAAFGFNQVPKQLYYTTLKKSNKFDTANLGSGVNEQNFPSKKKFHDFDDEFLIPNNNTSVIRGTGIQYSNGLGQSLPRKEKLINNEIPIKSNYNINIDEKENSPSKIEKNSNITGKNRLKSALKFIEESFDINKKNEPQYLSSNNIDNNSSSTGNVIQRDRLNNNSKKDLAKKFVEENMIFNEKNVIDNSPPKYMFNQNSNNSIKKVDINEDTGEYEFESRRKKR